jgi:hypothetical protein
MTFDFVPGDEFRAGLEADMLVEAEFFLADFLGLAFPPGQPAILANHATLGGGLAVGIGAVAVNCRT